MGKFVVLPLDGLVLAVEVPVLQLPRDGAVVAAAHVLKGRINSADTAVGFWTRGDQDHGIGQGDARLGQPDLQRNVTGIFDDGDDLRIGETHIFAGTDHQPPGGGGEISRLQQTGQVVERSIWVRSAHRFLESGDDIVVVISGPVVAHGRFLRQLLHEGVINGDALCALIRRQCKDGKLYGVDGFSDIAAAGLGNVADRFVGRGIGDAVLLR